MSWPSKGGFTLIELLVTIAIIGLLASVILASINVAREQAQIARAIADTIQIRNAVAFYGNDTNFTPPNCSPHSVVYGGVCTQGTDPFLNSMSVANWDGPYIEIWNSAHGWGGQMGIFNFIDESGTMVYGIVYDDDRPGTSPSDNQGRVPPQAMQRIDEILDDGDLLTGRFRGNNGTPVTWGFFNIVQGEAIFMLGESNCPPGMLQNNSCFQ
jgi:prepilin-type N-terminal cleavage/methylation domain-containing protein